jgi:uncharacterized protein (DUF1501 family)
MSANQFSRRNFIRTAGCGAMGTVTFFNSMLNLGLVNALTSPQAGAGDDYRALICVLLSGGNDSFNMLIPNGSEYAEYAAVRSNLAIPQAQVLGLSGSTQPLSLGVHPVMPEIQQLFDSGDAAFISNVGTLVERVTKAQVLNGGVSLPLGLLSHSDQVMQWQTSIPQDRSLHGWGGKMADIIKGMNSNQQLSMNISLAGNNVFQSGPETVEFSINSDTGGIGLFGHNEPDFFHQLLTSGVDSLLNQQYKDVFKDSYAGVINNSIQGNQLFNEAVELVPDFNTTFSQNYVSQSFEMIARTIAARDQLGVKRQTFFVNIGGFDNHDELLNNHSNLMTLLSQGIGQLYSALEEISMKDCVTTFTISDFARTLTSNGNGTDHAWGGNALVVGGAVNGGDVYGTFPSLALGSEYVLDSGGIVVPQISTDEYFAELALWFGVSPFDLPVMLPNIGNFYSVGSPDAPIGFMNV